jgi:hypothetical protein
VRPGSKLALRYGLYEVRPGGERMNLDAPQDDERRATGGLIHVDATLRWENEAADPNRAARAERLNTTGKVVDFGPVATNGAFRLRHRGEDWELTPLPGSLAFAVTLHLDRLGAAGKRVESVTAVDIDGKRLGKVTVHQHGTDASFDAAGETFSFRIRMKP